MVRLIPLFCQLHDLSLLPGVPPKYVGEMCLACIPAPTTSPTIRSQAAFIPSAHRTQSHRRGAFLLAIIEGKRSTILFASVACHLLAIYSWAQRCSTSDALIAYRPLLTQERTALIPPAWCKPGDPNSILAATIGLAIQDATEDSNFR